MLKDWNKVEQPTAEEVDKRLANAKNSLLQQQIAMKEKKLPVIVLLGVRQEKEVCLES